MQPLTSLSTDRQNKLYDFKFTSKVAVHSLKGFAVKKNVIVRFWKIKDLDQMIILESEHQIYDLVKVDYLVTDMTAIYTKLFEAAMDVINAKKTLYAKATGLPVRSPSRIFAEQVLQLLSDATL